MERYLWQNHRVREIPYLHVFYNLSSDPGICLQGGFERQNTPRLGKTGALESQFPTPEPHKVLLGKSAPKWQNQEEEDFPPPYLLGRAPALPEGRGPPPVVAPPQEEPPRIAGGAAGPPPLQPAFRGPSPIQPPTPQNEVGTPHVPASAPSLPSAQSPQDPDAEPLVGSVQPPEEGWRSERLKKVPERYTSANPGTFTSPTGIFPLRQVPGANGLVTIHTPFNTTDLYNWKMGLPPYRESPQKYVDLVTRIISTHHPNIPDLCALLSALLNEEEKRQVMAKAYDSYTEWRRIYIENQPAHQAGGGNDAPAAPMPPTAEECLCLNPPELANDPNTEFGRRMIEAARQAVREGLKKGVPRVVNFQRVYNTVQTPEESPAEFLTRLKDAYRRYTDVDPEDPGNLAAVRTTFIAQTAPDIRRKLQKLPAPSAQPLETLVQTAFQAFYQRPEVEKAEAEVKMRRKASLLAAAILPQWPNGRPEPRGERTQDPPPFSGRCYRCNERGHMAWECREAPPRGVETPRPPP